MQFVDSLFFIHLLRGTAIKLHFLEFSFFSSNLEVVQLEVLLLLALTRPLSRRFFYLEQPGPELQEKVGICFALLGAEAKLLPAVVELK